MKLAHVEAFLAVAEELHFGRAAERLYVSGARVSQRIAALEAEVGAKLFERTSRRVTLTELGTAFRDRVAPAHAEMLAALNEARRIAGQDNGLLRLGFTASTSGPALSRLLKTFMVRYPACELLYAEIDMVDPYGALRRGEIDVLCNWLVLDQADLVAGPVIEHRRRMLAVGREHRLALRDSVSVEDLGDEVACQMPSPPFPAALQDVFLPPATPSGRPIRRAVAAVHSFNEFLPSVAAGQLVHATVESVPLLAREDIVLVPLIDLPPMPLGLIWSATAENRGIRALARAAQAMQPTVPRDDTRRVVRRA